MADGPYYSMGEHTHKIPMKLFKINRSRLCNRLKSIPNLPQNSVVILQGGSDFHRYSTDTNVSEFRQESYFRWTFGVLEPDFYGILEVDSGKTTIFAPRLPESYVVWMGEIYPPEHFKKKYDVDEAYYNDEIVKVLKDKGSLCLLTLKGTNTDSGRDTTEAHFEGIEEFPKNDIILFPEITELRVFKTDLELDLLRYINRISSEAHKQVMLSMKADMYEYQGESVFLQHCYSEGGMRHVGYTCICGSGHNGSILHYGHAAAPNDKQVQRGDLCLFDMGGEYYGYVADITCTFPVDGKFSEKQKIIYNAVLNANRAVMKASKPGVLWSKMHELAEITMLEDLKKAGLLKGSVEEMMVARLGAVFMPHGLGHLMGLDVHDVGGYPKDVERIDKPGLKSLRTNRVLKEGMVITIEPGCYFIDPLLDQASNDVQRSKFLVKEVLEGYRGFGGVRIEDNIIITRDGVELMTNVPRTVEEIEAFLAKERNLCNGCQL